MLGRNYSDKVRHINQQPLLHLASLCFEVQNLNLVNGLVSPF